MSHLGFRKIPHNTGGVDYSNVPYNKGGVALLTRNGYGVRYLKFPKEIVIMILTSHGWNGMDGFSCKHPGICYSQEPAAGHIIVYILLMMILLEIKTRANS